MSTGPKPILTLAEAVRTYVPEGQELFIGGFAYSDPMALAHELIRQKRRHLYVMKTSGGVLVDQLVGAGCVDKLLLCHVWNSVGPVPAHCFRRAIEQGYPHPIAIEEMSFGAFTSALIAGGCGLPFMPTTPVQGAGHFAQRTFLPNKFAVVENPFDGRSVCVVPPLRPALGVFHVHRTDRFGNAQLFGPTAEMRYAIAACQKVIVIAEEIVDTDVVRETPEATIAPGFMVEAVVVEPWAAHPTDSYRYYLRDLDHHALYGRLSKTVEGYQDYLDEWVFGCPTHHDLLAKLAPDRVQALQVRAPWWSQ